MLRERDERGVRLIRRSFAHLFVRASACVCECECDVSANWKRGMRELM